MAHGGSVTALFHALRLQALFIDQTQATDKARTLALRLNGEWRGEFGRSKVKVRFRLRKRGRDLSYLTYLTLPPHAL
jgi:hypothetical protein